MIILAASSKSPWKDAYGVDDVEPEVVKQYAPLSVGEDDYTSC